MNLPVDMTAHSAPIWGVERVMPNMTTIPTFLVHAEDNTGKRLHNILVEFIDQRRIVTRDVCDHFESSVSIRNSLRGYVMQSKQKNRNAVGHAVWLTQVGLPSLEANLEIICRKLLNYLECNHHYGEENNTLVFVAHYGAPGIGKHYKCSNCDEDFSVIGDTVFMASEGAHILSPEDVI